MPANAVPLTRDEIINHAKTDEPMNSRAYDQGALDEAGYRDDCSGKVARWWRIPLAGYWGGPNTVTLVTDGWMTEVHPSEILPGDAVGKCGPGTDGDNGHVRLFKAWSNNDPNDSSYEYIEMSPNTGPKEGHSDGSDWYTLGGEYHAYRYVDLVTPPPPPPPAPVRRFATVETYTDGSVWDQTLGGIAGYFGVSVAYLCNLNGIANPNLVYPGQKIWIDPA